jgi:hypothetical protein
MAMVGRKKDNPPASVPQPRGTGAVPGEPEKTEEEYDGPGARAIVGEPVEGSYQVREPEATMQELEDQPEDEALQEEEPMVEYLGEFTAREITLEDWKKAGVRDQPAARWDSTNNRKIPLGGFTEHALRVLRQDGNFRIGE